MLKTDIQSKIELDQFISIFRIATVCSAGFKKKSLKILIREDDSGLRDDIHFYLKEKGNICDAISNMSAAIDNFYMYDYDCVLLDIGLPDGSGLEIWITSKENQRMRLY